MQIDGSFLRRVMLLGGGTAAGHAILFSAYPILTRLYTPADFGVLGAYAAFLTVLTRIAAWRFNAAIPVPRQEAAALNLLVLSIVAVVATSLVTLVVVWMSGTYIARLLDTPELAGYLWFLPLALMGSGIYLSLNAWAARNAAYGLIAKTRISQSCLQVGLQIGVGLFSHGALGLVLGDAAGRAGGAGTLTALITRRNMKWHKDISTNRILAVARRYRRLPLFSTWSTLLNGLGTQLPSLLLLAVFGAAVAGWFNLAVLVLQAPVLLLGQAIAQVFLTDAGASYRQGRLPEYTGEMLHRLVAVAAAPALLFILVAPALFAGLFGEEWRDAGHYARWLTPYVFVTFISAHLPGIVIVLGLQRGELFFQVVLLLFRTISLIAGAYVASPLFTVALYAAVSVVMLSGYSCWLLRKAQCGARSLLKNTGRELAASAVLASPACIGLLVFDGLYRWVLVMLGVCFVGWYVMRTVRALWTG